MSIIILTTALAPVVTNNEISQIFSNNKLRILLNPYALVYYKRKAFFILYVLILLVLITVYMYCTFYFLTEKYYDEVQRSS
jgi:hypothetical protein